MNVELLDVEDLKNIYIRNINELAQLKDKKDAGYPLTDEDHIRHMFLVNEILKPIKDRLVKLGEMALVKSYSLNIEI